MKDMVTFGSNKFYLLLFTPVLLVFFAMAVNSTSPERRIVGAWQETSWEYEKVDKHYEHGGLMPKTISDNIKQEILGNLIIHESESWTFLPDGKLLLRTADNKIENLEWKLSGRGHVLVIKHADGLSEHYKVQRVSNNELVLHFDTDIQAKGIVNMTFKRID